PRRTAAPRTSASRGRRSSSSTRRRTASTSSTPSIAIRATTTVRRSRASTGAGAIVALTMAIAGGAGVSAHRADEYLQAARLAIAPGRVQLELDMTPGIALAEASLADIDRDRDGSLSVEEQRAYARLVLGALDLEIDGRR